VKWVLDRLEDGYAVCEEIDTRESLTVPAQSLPAGASPGDVLFYDGNNFVIDRTETKSRRKRINKMFKDLWDNG